MSEHAIIVVDLGYGDAGKGTLVDFLTRQTGAQTIVRFNGGAQAAHNVITPDGRHHTFAQFGSGMLVPGTRTHLSRFMLVDPYAIFNEADHLQALGVPDPLGQTTLDRRALIITPYQQAANRLREIARGTDRHGSCGMGIGETMADWLHWGTDVLFAGDMADLAATRRKLHRLREAKIAALTDVIAAVRDLPAAQDDLAVFADDAILDIAAENCAYLAGCLRLVDDDYLPGLLRAPGTVTFEGAQGVLLDEWHGFHPYTTWSTTTFANALTLLDEARFAGPVTRLGAQRTYMGRHGAGPFITGDAALRDCLTEAHNATNPWQQHFRTGYFDLLATRYALDAAGGADALAITHLDRLRALPGWQVCTAYDYPGPADDWAGLADCDTLPTGGSRITALHAAHDRDLDRQSALTRRLLHCTPVYDDWTPPAGVSANPAIFAERLAAALDVPLAITSHGPNARDKHIWPAWQARAAGPVRTGGARDPAP